MDGDMSTVFDSFEECVARIETDFQVDLASNERHRTLLLRGENEPYPRTESSMKRFLTAEDGKTMKPFYYVSPFIDFEEIYSEFHAEAHGLDSENGVGFLQHYGFPTDLFDLSPSLENTRFFAAYGSDTESIACVGVFPRASVRSLFILTDLSDHPIAQRPRRQVAYVARPPAGIVDLKDARCDSLLGSKWYRFRKSQADREFVRSRLSHVYPTEAELAYFFGGDFTTFFREHWTNRRWTDEQRRLVDDKLTAIRGQLK